MESGCDSRPLGRARLAILCPRGVATRGNLHYDSGYSRISALTGSMKRINEVNDALKLLGLRLRDARLKRDDTMATFAERLGVSERTVRAMEQGRPTVQIGTWVNALLILEALDSLTHVLEVRESLLDRARSGRPQRQRASRRSA